MVRVATGSVAESRNHVARSGYAKVVTRQWLGIHTYCKGALKMPKMYKIRLGCVEQSKDAVFMIPKGEEHIPVAVVAPACQMATVMQVAEDMNADVFIIPRGENY
jgi:hypothetical protein